jgi:hypothetical protein
MQVQQLWDERTTPETTLPNELLIANELKQGNRSDVQKSTVPFVFSKMHFFRNARFSK